MMESVEAILENENNSNVESESSFRDREEKIWVDEVCTGASHVSSSARNSDVGNSDLALETKSSNRAVVEAKNINKNIGNEEEGFACEASMEVEQLNSVTNLAETSENSTVSLQEHEDSTDASCISQLENAGTSKVSEMVGNTCTAGKNDLVNPLKCGMEDNDDDVVILNHSENHLEKRIVDEGEDIDATKTDELDLQTSVGNSQVHFNSDAVSEGSSDVNQSRQGGIHGDEGNFEENLHSDVNQSRQGGIHGDEGNFEENLHSDMNHSSIVQSQKEISIVAENVLTNVDEPENSDVALTTTSPDVYDGACVTSEVSRQVYSPLDATNNNNSNGEKVVTKLAVVEGTLSSLPEVKNTSESSVKHSSDLTQEDTVSTDADVELVEVVEERSNATKGEVNRHEPVRDRSQVQSESTQINTGGLDAETTTHAVSKSTKYISGQNDSAESNGSARTTNNVASSDQEPMKASEIKTECVAYNVNGSTDDVVMYHSEPASQEIKHESQQGKADNIDEDVMVIDDEGEIVPLKKESWKTNASKNGVDVEISGQKLRVSAETKLAISSEPGNSKSDSVSRSKSIKQKLQTCIVCQKICRCKYNIVRNGDIKHLCDDPCFKTFRKTPTIFLKHKDNQKMLKDTVSGTLINSAVNVSSLDTVPRQDSIYKTCSVCLVINVNTSQPFCNWKGLDFCGESCLGKFQANLTASCSFCHAYIPTDVRTNFCLKIGNDMRPFCKQRCYNEFKKQLRLCSFCQRDLSSVPGAFTAMVGTDSKFKEFCSQVCMRNLESQINDVEILSAEKGNMKQETSTCSVCRKQGQVKYTVRLQKEWNKLCSDLCLSAFQYTNKINMGRCDNCGVPCTTEEAQAHFIQYEGKVKHFCGDVCVNVFRKENSRIMPCGWCGVKKLNFDMIERLDTENKFQLFCSLNCLSLYRVNLQAKSNQAVQCDHCHKVVPAQYHLTMSDATVRNFCSYICVMDFQVQFEVQRVPPVTASTPPQPLSSSPGQFLPQGTPAQQQNQLPTAPVVRGGRGGRMVTQEVSAKEQSPSYPVISSVVSLAAHEVNQTTLPVPQSTPAAPSSFDVAAGVPQASNMMPSGDGKHQILIQAAPPKNAKNKSLQCRPVMLTKATSCRPHSQSKEVQTDEVPMQPVLIPVPVPIYVPVPMIMYTAPAPKLVPVPIPIPVPVFIPTTRKSVNGICKTVQEIVERVPADPLEAEMLMMAEAVAADARTGDSDTDTESEVADQEVFDTQVESEGSVPREDESSQMGRKARFGGEDTLQAALRMAEEISGPIEDLESSVELLAVKKDPPAQQQKIVESYQKQDDDDDDDDDDYIPPQTYRGRGAKRANRGRPPSTRPKRHRLERSGSDDDSTSQSAVSSRSQSVEPPSDVNYRLKFTYGLNAWRHWVISKNMQIEKSKPQANARARTFPTDILKCTVDELNMSLCLFVDEVRKPSGHEYSPDSIYYLCLGIQQYLYENGRIDSIFTDAYFETFTDRLHEILKTLQPKINKHGQMLCRIEEEHLWESKQLGAHSPFVLLNTLVYFHTKYFILKTVQEHMSLSFAQILKHWKKGAQAKGQLPSCAKNVSLRYYCLSNGKKDGMIAKKGKEGVPVYEVTENIENPLRCPVKLYEFFLSKCPETIKNRNDIFYPIPERSCVPDSPVWYSAKSIDIHTMDKMLTRILLVREIQEAHLHAQPMYL